MSNLDLRGGDQPRIPLILISDAGQPAQEPATTMRAPWMARVAESLMRHTQVERAAFAVVQLQDDATGEKKPPSLAVRFLMPSDPDHCYAIATPVPKEPGGIDACFVELSFRVARFARETWDMAPARRIMEAEQLGVRAMSVDFDFQG